jgi:hypothetical protein
MIKLPATKSTLLELAVLASAPIDRGVDHLLIPGGLTGDAGGDARQGLAPAQWDFVSALDTLQRAFALREASASAPNAIGDGVLDLIEDSAFVRPARRHIVRNSLCLRQSDRAGSAAPKHCCELAWRGVFDIARSARPAFVR